MQPTRTHQITLPPLSFKKREVAYIRCLSKMHKSDRVDREDDNREPATVMRVTDLQDGGEYRLVCPALMVSAFADEDFEYVEKCFEIRVSPEPKPGKRYKEVEVYQIKDPGDKLIEEDAATTKRESNET